jgi:hypothetical protein
MGITKILSTTSCKRVIEYLEKTKYEDAVRNVGFSSVGINAMDPYSSFSRLLSSKDKLNESRRREGKKEVQEAKHIINSFALDELDPSNEEDIEKAKNIMRELMLNDYKEYGAASVGYLQTDNGFIHFHRLYPTVTIDGKGLKGDIYNFYHCAHKLDNAMEKYGVNQSILTMKERAEGYVKDGREVLTGPKKNSRNEIKAYIAEVIDEGLKDVNINSEDKFKEYLESKDISLNKRKRVGDSREAGFDIYDWTYEYHYVDKGPKLKDKSMKVRAKQITDENGEMVYNPDPIAERLALNLKEFNRVAEENRKKREEESKKELSLEERLEQIGLKYRRVYNPETGEDKMFKDLSKAEKEEVINPHQEDLARRKAAIDAKIKEDRDGMKAEVEARKQKEAEEPINNEEILDKDGNGIADYHEELVNKRVKEIEALDSVEEKPKQKVVRKTKQRTKGPSKAEFNAFINHKFDGDDEKDDNSFGR